VCWDPYREGQVSALNRVQKGAANFANNINESGWETLAQRRLTARICALFKAYTGGRAWKAIGGQTSKTILPSRDDHNWKIRARKQRTNVGKYSFVNLLLLVFGPWAGLGRDQSSVRRLVWLWYAASWASS